ncbi:MAG: glycoside hydrolase family 3 N-terminal domain-containing protein [Gaiellaceae bacterium]
MRKRRILILAIALSAAFLLLSQGSSAERLQQPTLSQLVGQHLLVRMKGMAPTASLLARVRRGEIGGVVLFTDNYRSPEGARRLIVKLQAAARAGGQLPLLIAIDQEGGAVKRLPGPPTEAPSKMASVATAHAQGLATGRYLHGLGIDLDLAPVLDVPASPRAFIAPRAFSSNATLVGARGTAFAEGLIDGGVAASPKHFPGLGRLLRSTDFAPGRIKADRAALARDLSPFRVAIDAGMPALMVGTASYPAYGDDLPAACSAQIVTGLLRGSLGFQGVVLSDDLNTPGVRPVAPFPGSVIRAVKAGVDMIYVSGAGSGTGGSVSEQAYSALLQAARRGTITRSQLQASYDRVQELKAQFAEAS